MTPPIHPAYSVHPLKRRGVRTQYAKSVQSIHPCTYSVRSPQVQVGTAARASAAALGLGRWNGAGDSNTPASARGYRGLSGGLLEPTRTSLYGARC